MTKTPIDGPRHGAARKEAGPRQIQVLVFAGRTELETALRELAEGSPVELAVVWTNGGGGGPKPETTPRPEPTRYVRRLPVASGADSEIRYLKVEEIDWIEAESQYVRLHFLGKSLLARGPAMTMSNLAARLDPEQFMRVHRSQIVNLERVVGLRTEAPSKRYVVLVGGNKVPVSQAHWEQLQAALVGCDWG